MTRAPLIRASLGTLTACALLLAGCSDPPAPEAAAPPAGAEAAPAPVPTPGAVRERVRELREARSQWWQDDDTLASLGIGGDQRAALQDAVQRGQAALEAGTQRVADANAAYRAAVAAGDLAGAREAAVRYASEVEAQALARQLLPVEVLELLPETARQRLLERPGLLAALVRGGRTPGAALRARRGARGDETGATDAEAAD